MKYQQKLYFYLKKYKYNFFHFIQKTYNNYIIILGVFNKNIKYK